ncbi:MAG TPA: neutral/alkaline non-lysosomal ceramidase N-terminal domain-containing protein [Bryobacteraceae bacterium]|nr:neutral/alkaline non-lysosomal ceramidase N-terminal domain-containing protein [Bryobacteraceae bacterium]
MRTAALLFIAALVSAAQTGPALRAGLARVEITPSGSMQMYGYAKRKCGPSNGTHDPLYAKALVLEAGDSRMAIVTLDLGSMVSNNLRQEVAAKLNIPLLLLAASHTHSAPAFLPYGSAQSMGPDADAYLAEVERRILSAVEQASKSMFDARLGIGRGLLQLGYNRLLVRDDGRARALFDNLDRVPHGPVDPEFVLLRIDDASGRARALLVHYAAHAVVLGPTNCKYSADYPGVLQAKLEAEFEGVQCMFVQGGAGDINPLFQGRTGKEEDDFRLVQKMGELLAAEVVRANRRVQMLPPRASSIQSKTEVLTFRDRWEPDKKLEVGIATVLINGEIALATLPGEPMHKLQRMWKEQADVPHPLFYGYTYTSGGTWAGYIPDLRSAAYGGYGADASTRIEVGAGEALIQRHLMNLYGLRGMWHDKPGRP